MWEYYRLDEKYATRREIVDKMNELGKENWEAIYYMEEKPIKFGDTYKIAALFKRIKT
jgi:hypothetical protein